MLSPKAKRDIYRIIPFGVIWFVFGFIYLMLEHGILGHTDVYPATGNPYYFGANTYFSLFGITLAGILGGTLEVKYLNRLFIEKSFVKKMFYKTLIYVAIICALIIFVVLDLYSLNIRDIFSDLEIRQRLFNFVSSFAFISIGLYCAAVMVVSLFFLEVHDSLGVNSINNFFGGKYHTPKEEERIFMFLDMKASTTIAEDLGHVKYFELLQKYYAVLTDSIINTSGEIYQYVGDEIVISWSVDKGLDNHNVLACFFGMKRDLEAHANLFMSKFGVLPVFKAGLHIGEVTTGEIGIIKKDIIFTGDVLNTTARIQELCNANGVEILLSGQLKEKLPDKRNYIYSPIGNTSLRGRNESIELYTVLQS